MYRIDKHTHSELRSKFGNEYTRYLLKYLGRGSKLYTLPMHIPATDWVQLDVPNTDDTRKAIQYMLDSKGNRPYTVVLCLPYEYPDTKELRRLIEDIIEDIIEIPRRKFPTATYLHPMKIRMSYDLKYRTIDYVKEAAYQLGVYDANNI